MNLKEIKDVIFPSGNYWFYFVLVPFVWSIKIICYSVVDYMNLAAFYYGVTKYGLSEIPDWWDWGYAPLLTNMWGVLYIVICVFLIFSLISDLSFWLNKREEMNCNGGSRTDQKR